ncbi:endolytic transglycosylase MltG [Cryobacterium tepidiphilum]|uniref:endolytic transglycosylase MltG n=1 Tax=Cryobacterium tepidiphilum TaxID=2486026 RepID=UPI001F45794D|nr:endolytic transglycosylase MltG [Cryobacterium tepidiphilum]
MAGFPPDPSDPNHAEPTGPEGAARDGAQLDWEHFLGGDAAGDVTPDAGGTAPDDANRPLSRREARNRDHGATAAATHHRLREHAPREKRKRGPWGCLIALIVVVALLGAGFIALQGPLSQVREAIMGPGDYTGTGDKDVVVTIQEGEDGSDIADTLVKNDVVKSFDAFYQLLLSQRPAPVFHPGSYQLKTHMSARSALDLLLDPDSRVDAKVVIPEGTVEADVLQLVSEATGIPLDALKKAAADPQAYGLPPQAKTLEGFLFPATYTFQPGTTAEQAITTMVDRSFQALDEAGVAPKDRWRTIVLASLVQKEAGLAEDYPKVARVFLNRLNPDLWSRGLESDATVAYGTGHSDRVATTDDERQDAGNPYNTYVHKGLPPGPISNPGDLAINAALHPADGPWLFFVTWNLETGETIFSTTGEEHQAAVDKWLAWMDDHPEYK